MTIKPLHDHVIVRPNKEDEITASGIVLPETIDKERPERGEVIAIGDGKISNEGNKIPMSVKVGEVVMFKKYSPDEIKVDGEDLLVIKESDIMAIIQ